MHRVVLAFIIAVFAGLGLAAQGSQAAQEQVELDCGADGTFTLLVNGNGQFAPGRIIGGGVVVPVAFADQHLTFDDGEGHVFEEFPPDVVKGNGHPGSNKNLVTCDFSLTFEEQGGTGSFSGTVTAFIVGR